MSRELKYKLSIEAELKQAKDAALELEQQIKAAKGAGRAWDDLGKSLAMVEQRMASLEVAARKAGQAADLDRYQNSKSQAGSGFANPRAGAAEQDRAMALKSTALKQEIAARKELNEVAKKEVATYTSLSPATQQYIAGLKEQAAATKKVSGGKEEARKAVAMVGGASPLAGVAASFAVLGALAGLIELGKYAVNKYRESIANLMDAFKDTAFESFTGIMDRQKRALQDLSIAAADYSRNLRQTLAKRDNPSESLTHVNDLAQVRISAEDRVAQAKQAAEAAWVQNSVQNEDLRQRLLAGIEEKYAKQKLARDRAAAAREVAISRLKEQYEAAYGASLSVPLASARQKRDSLGTVATLDDKEAADKKRLADTISDREAKEARIAEIKKVWRVFRPTTTQHELAYLEEQTGQLDDVEMKLRAKIAQNDRQNPGKRAAISAANAEVSRLEGLQSGAAERLNDLRRNNDWAEAAARINIGADASAAGYATQARGYAMLPHNPAMARAYAGSGGNANKAVEDTAKFTSEIAAEMKNLNRKLNGPFANK